jgi:hypothetical protein
MIYSKMREQIMHRVHLTWKEGKAACFDHQSMPAPSRHVRIRLLEFATYSVQRPVLF